MRDAMHIFIGDPYVYQYLSKSRITSVEDKKVYSTASLFVSPFFSCLLPNEIAHFQTDPAMFLTLAEAPLEQRSLYSYIPKIEPKATPDLLWITPAGDLLAAFYNDQDYSKDGFYRWFSIIVELHHAVALWQLLQCNDTKRLASHFKWDKDDQRGNWVRYDSHPELPKGAKPKKPDKRLPTYFATDKRSSNILNTIPFGDSRTAATIYLQRLLNKKIKNDLMLQMLWDHHQEKPCLVNLPRKLETAIWLQFAQAFSGGKSFKQCGNCKKWMESSSASTRSDKLYCSDYCRVQAGQARKREAIKLWKKHVSVDEIAKKVGSDIKTINKWIEGYQNKHNKQ